MGLYYLRREMKSFYKENVFGDTFKDILILSKEIELDFNESNYSKDFGRFDIVFDFKKDLEEKILNVARKEFDIEDLEITYNQLTKYKIVDGYRPKLNGHVDKLPCTHTIDLCIETTVPEWGLYVENSLFKDKPGGSVFLKGDEDNHGRPEYPSSKENDYCLMLFVNLAPKGFWALDVKKRLGNDLINSRYYPISLY
jgi:hypothetical protein